MSSVVVVALPYVYMMYTKGQNVHIRYILYGDIYVTDYVLSQVYAARSILSQGLFVSSMQEACPHTTIPEQLELQLSSVHSNLPPRTVNVVARLLCRFSLSYWTTTEMAVSSRPRPRMPHVRHHPDAQPATCIVRVSFRCLSAAAAAATAEAATQIASDSSR